MMKQKKLFNKNYLTTSGNYGYADLKENGSLKVTMSKSLGDGTFERDSFIISRETMNEFCSILNPPKPSKSYSVEEKRATQGQNAYTTWTKEDENRLEHLFINGYSIKQLADIFERGTGAIKARLSKLGLM